MCEHVRVCGGGWSGVGAGAGWMWRARGGGGGAAGHRNAYLHTGEVRHLSPKLDELADLLVDVRRGRLQRALLAPPIPHRLLPCRLGERPSPSPSPSPRGGVLFRMALGGPGGVGGGMACAGRGRASLGSARARAGAAGVVCGLAAGGRLGRGGGITQSTGGLGPRWTRLDGLRKKLLEFVAERSRHGRGARVVLRRRRRGIGRGPCGDRKTARRCRLRKAGLVKVDGARLGGHGRGARGARRRGDRSAHAHGRAHGRLDWRREGPLLPERRKDLCGALRAKLRERSWRAAQVRRPHSPRIASCFARACARAPSSPRRS